VAFIYGIYALYIRLFTDKAIEGWTSLLIVILLIGGIQLITIGILGEYVGKLFIEHKKRPHYIIKEQN
jgi:dolichol-phosphate mannosyltransferase